MLMTQIFTKAKKSQFKSKLEVNELFVKSPINLKCVLSQNERDFIEAVIHLQSLGKYHTSDSLIMANSGLNANQITLAKKNLVQMGLITVASDKSPQGSRYIINEGNYNCLLRQLNSIKLAPERFEFGDRLRSECGLKTLFKNIINTLSRRLTTDFVPDNERITKVEESQQPLSYEEQKVALKKLRDNGSISQEQYYKKYKELKSLTH
jgi:hypothetical protein